MKNMNRREFLRLCGLTGATVSLTGLVKADILEAFGGPENGKPPVIWLQGGSCSGCSVSLLNTVEPDIAQALTGVISLKFHQTLMAAAGESAMNVLTETRNRFRGEYYLVIEGTVPLGADGQYATLGEKGEHPITFSSWVKSMAASAKAVIAVGSCAAFGGIPAGKPNPTGSVPVSKVVSGVPLINLPGCPTHPDWVLGSLVHVIKYGVPKLDRLRRPTVFYGRCVHDLCERRPAFDNGHFATRLSERGCLYKLGCKGPMAYADCPSRRFNGAVNWCVGANSPCLACVEPEFPDATEPFFVRMPEYGPAGTVAPTARGVKLIGGAE